MPIFSDRRVSTRGIQLRGKGAAAGGGLGLVGLVLYLILGALGGDAGSLLQMPFDGPISGTGETAGQMEQRCNEQGAIERHDDCYLVKVYNEINEIWHENLSDYRDPGLAFFEGGTSTSCGAASSDVGPFYCPADETIFIDIGFLEALQQEFGATGRYAQAYILAHEAGHHIQNMRGKLGGRLSNKQSIEIELQADCLAGVWGRLADNKGNVAVTESEVREAMDAAAAVGDDRIQEKTSGRVDPEAWTHGSAKQRREAFTNGFRNAGRCGI